MFLSSGLQATLLIRHPETKQLLVNFDPLLYQVMREAECMRKHDLEIPEAAHIICLGQEQLKENFNTLKVNYILTTIIVVTCVLFQISFEVFGKICLHKHF